MAQPKPSPTQAEIIAASNVYGAWLLHYYQVLYFHQPRLTEPGLGTRPFNVSYCPEHMACLRLNVPAAPEYGFLIKAYDLMDDPDYDARLLRFCGLIQGAIKDNKSKPHSSACCGLAETRFCVCVYSCHCEIHGTTCIGSHD